MSKKLSSEWFLILALAFLKLIIHFITNTNYELHRDAYLYLAQGDHLDWSFLSVPPTTAVIGNITRFLFGDSVFSIRLFPAIIGAVSVIMIGLIIRNLGGKIWAILLGCTAFIVSPAFLRSNTLFQPVAFDAFYWLLSTYFILKLIQTQNPKFWIHLGITWGLAFLAKYNIGFLILAFGLALLFTSDRKLFLSKYFLYGSLLGLLIVLPNLVWQYNHNFPVVYHMTRLRETQLAHVRVIDFLMAQVLMNFSNLWVWLLGMAFILFFKAGKKYRVLGYTYLAVVLLYILLKGKGYYALGIYPILFAFGGVAIEKYAEGKLSFLKPAILALMILTTLPLLPYSLPVLPLDKMVVYGEKSKQFGGEGALRWEDGRIYPLPQDYADMTGWKELSDIVIKAYQSLSDSDKSDCVIYAENYGQAGAIKYYAEKYGLPEPVCFSESFLFWAPDSANFKTLIYVNDDTNDVSYYFTTVELVGRITDPYARESGLPVWLCRTPRNGFEQFYADKVKGIKDRFRRSQ
ncbi:MAG: glycosyltransferase family 39 protein [candidate division KSB1 bacterium]|nr:glycosyltransferase family 39 protein [candidate division KSB1 bacterium]MDZ7339729.1 glycosyltransferase family 39 protein [candidate division KSB1 bacterium]